jgi:hypothetical protein
MPDRSRLLRPTEAGERDRSHRARCVRHAGQRFAVYPIDGAHRGGWCQRADSAVMAGLKRLILARTADAARAKLIRPASG